MAYRLEHGRRRRSPLRRTWLVLSLSVLGVAGVMNLPGVLDAAQKPAAPLKLLVAPFVSTYLAPAYRDIPDLRRFALPSETGQALLVVGDSRTSSRAAAVLWQRGADGLWRPGTQWTAHNGLRGWTAEHFAGDLHTPIGVFTLTDAGGLAADPGTRLPYTHSRRFRALGTGFEGEPLTGAFDYVIAINYNHLPGTSPLSSELPLGPRRGAGLWVHVDHDGPTHGCVTLPREAMAALLRALDPALHPVIVMADHGDL